MNIKDTNNTTEGKEEDEFDEYKLAYDNMVSALGKIIHYQNNSQVVQGNLNELISKWIMNLPIKQDDTEQEEQTCRIFLK